MNKDKVTKRNMLILGLTLVGLLLLSAFFARVFMP